MTAKASGRVLHAIAIAKTGNKSVSSNRSSTYVGSEGSLICTRNSRGLPNSGNATFDRGSVFAPICTAADTV